MASLGFRSLSRSDLAIALRSKLREGSGAVELKI